jgi:hypothetical protein
MKYLSALGENAKGTLELRFMFLSYNITTQLKISPTSRNRG